MLPLIMSDYAHQQLTPHIHHGRTNTKMQFCSRTAWFVTPPLINCIFSFKGPIIAQQL